MGGRAEVILRCTSSGVVPITAVPTHSNSTVDEYVQDNVFPFYRINITLFTINVTSTSAQKSSFNVSTTYFQNKTGYIADTLNAANVYYTANCINYSVPNFATNENITWINNPDGGSKGCAFVNLTVQVISSVGKTSTYQNVNLSGSVFGINGQYFRHDFPLARLVSNRVYQMTAAFGPHPFHHHINPYQLLDDLGSGFFGQRGEWRDVVSSGIFQNLSIRTRTADFTGKIIMHCHFLPHEDRGLMGFYIINNTVPSCTPGTGDPIQPSTCDFTKARDDYIFCNINTSKPVVIHNGANIVNIGYYLLYSLSLVISLFLI